MPLPLLSPPTPEITGSSDPDVWAGAYGSPIVTGRIPVWPEKTADLKVAHDFSPSLPEAFANGPKPAAGNVEYMINHAAGNLSEYKSVTHAGDAAVDVVRAMTEHGYLGSPYSLRIQPIGKRDVSIARQEFSVATNADIVRFYLATDGDEIFAPGQGFVFYDKGDGTTQSVELALVNPEPEPMPPKLQLLIGGVVAYTTETFRGGIPQFVELFVKRTSTTQVRLHFEDAAKPVFKLISPTIAATNVKVNRFGTLRWLGNHEVPDVTAYISSFAGSANFTPPSEEAFIGKWAYESPGAGYVAHEVTHGHPGALDGDWVWFPSGSNADLNQTTLTEQLEALPVVETLLTGYVGPIESPWVKASFATEVGYVEFSWGYYMEPFSPSTAVARWSADTLEENCAVGVDLRRAPEVLTTGTWEVWSWMATAAKTGWRLVMIPTNIAENKYTMKMECWVSGSTIVTKEKTNVVVEPFAGGGITLVMLNGKAYAYAHKNSSTEPTLMLENNENFIGSFLVSPYAGIGVGEHWFPSLENFRMGTVSAGGLGGAVAPTGLRALNTRAPGHRPISYLLRTDEKPVDVMYTPVIVDDYVMWATLHTNGTNVSVLDKATGSFIGNVFLSGVSIDVSNTPFALDHGLFFVDVGGTGHLVDPQLLAERWKKTLSPDGTFFSTQVFPLKIPGSSVAFVMSTLRKTNSYLTFYDKRGQTLKDLILLSTSIQLTARYVDSDQIAYFFGQSNGHRFLYRTTLTSTPESQTTTYTTTFSNYEAVSTEYPLSDSTNFLYACTSRRRNYLAMSSTNVAFITAFPAYATNSRPQKLTLRVMSKTGTAIFNKVIAENATGNTGWGCKLGGVLMDEAGNSYVTFSKPNGSGTDVWYLSVVSPTGTYLVQDLIVPDAGPYPLPASGQGGFMYTPMQFAEGNTPYDSFLSAENVVRMADVEWTVGVSTGVEGERPSTSQQDRVPLPLAPGSIEGGGVLEILLKEGDELRRIAIANDVTSGLTMTRDLTSLTKLKFSVPWDVFVASADGSQGTLRELQESWEAEHGVEGQGPFNKVDKIRDNVYLRYTSPKDVTTTFRMQNLDTEEVGALEGLAVHAGQELSDSLTQYKPGRSQFAGLMATEILEHVLRGDQSVRIQNRRFVRDALPRLDLATEVPDMSQAATGPVPTSPVPYVAELVGVSPEQAALFSGLPFETVPPHGTTRNLVSGSVGYHAFNDVVVSETQKTFTTWAVDGPAAGPINWSATPPATFFAGEQAERVTRVVYGCIKADVSGVYSFKVETDDGLRAWFRGQKVYDNFTISGVNTVTFTGEMEAGKWYPFIFHHINGAGPQVLKFYYTPPGGSEVIVPANKLSYQMHGGLFPVRMVDNSGSQCFVLCYKRWDGRALVLGIPLPYKISSPSYAALGVSNYHWPVGLTPGTTIEEIRWPNDPGVYPAIQVIDWGSGWTRRPGPRALTQPNVPSAVFQHRAEAYR